MFTKGKTNKAILFDHDFFFLTRSHEQQPAMQPSHFPVSKAQLCNRALHNTEKRQLLTRASTNCFDRLAEGWNLLSFLGPMLHCEINQDSKLGQGMIKYPVSWLGMIKYHVLQVYKNKTMSVWKGLLFPCKHRLAPNVFWWQCSSALLMTTTTSNDPNELTRPGRTKLHIFWLILGYFVVWPRLLVILCNKTATIRSSWP